MALIICPECSKEISSIVKACPHCGYPFDTLNLPLETPRKVEIISANKQEANKKKMRKTAIFVSSLLLIVALIISCYVIIQGKRATEYINNAKSLVRNIERGVSEAEAFATIYNGIWSKTIDRGYFAGDLARFLSVERNVVEDLWISIDENSYNASSDNSIHKPLIQDFNIALQITRDILLNGSRYKAYSELNATIVAEASSLSSPPKEKKDISDEIVELFAMYRSLSEKSLSPEGSLNSYGDFLNEDFSSIKKKITELTIKLN